MLGDDFAFREPGNRGRLMAAGILPAFTWTAVAFTLQVALYSAWFIYRASQAELPPHELLWSLLVLILVSPIFDAAVFALLYLVQFPLLWRQGRLSVGIWTLTLFNSAAIAAGAFALVGSGCHVILTIAAVPAMAGAAAGAMAHLRHLERSSA